MAFGKSFCDHFNIDESIFRSIGVLNPTLDVDSRLFINPFLLPHSKHPEFSGCATEIYEEHFTKIYTLIRASDTEESKTWKAALRLFQFSEAKGMSGTCLGYSKSSTSGHAFGKEKAAKSLAWAKEVIDLGVKDPELFSLVSLFEDGVGPDLISDMVAAITIDCILAFNSRVLAQLEKETGITIPKREYVLRGSKAFLPENPFSSQKDPVILISDDILDNLPALDDPRDIPELIENNENIKERVNAHIGQVFKTKSKKDKDHIKTQAMASAVAFQTFLDLIKLMENDGYDIYSDPDGLLAWREAAASAVAIYKLDIVIDASKDEVSRLNSVCVQIINQFAQMVEKNRLYRTFYVGNKPRKEKYAQMLFFAIATSYCEANGIGVTPEADAGVGPVDFKFHDGEHKILVEIKLSKNSKTYSGYEKQLGAYMEAESADLGHYVVIDVGSMGKKWKRLNEFAKEHPAYAKKHKLHLVDGTPKPSASNR